LGFIYYSQYCSPGQLVTSEEEGIKSMQKVWSEIIDLPEEVSPLANSIQSFGHFYV